MQFQVESSSCCFECSFFINASYCLLFISAFVVLVYFWWITKAFCSLSLLILPTLFPVYFLLFRFSVLLMDHKTLFCSRSYHSNQWGTSSLVRTVNENTLRLPATTMFSCNKFCKVVSTPLKYDTCWLTSFGASMFTNIRMCFVDDYLPILSEMILSKSSLTIY